MSRGRTQTSVLIFIPQPHTRPNRTPSSPASTAACEREQRRGKDDVAGEARAGRESADVERLAGLEPPTSPSHSPRRAAGPPPPSPFAAGLLFTPGRSHGRAVPALARPVAQQPASPRRRPPPPGRPPAPTGRAPASTDAPPPPRWSPASSPPTRARSAGSLLRRVAKHGRPCSHPSPAAVPGELGAGAQHDEHGRDERLAHAQHGELGASRTRSTASSAAGHHGAGERRGEASGGGAARRRKARPPDARRVVRETASRHGAMARRGRGRSFRVARAELKRATLAELQRGAAGSDGVASGRRGAAWAELRRAAPAEP
nr:uncharacterized protein LOC127330400 [Lolium perenne]